MPEPRAQRSIATTHIAGLDVQVGQRLRQRCGWCGATLDDYDLARIAVPIGQNPRPATWPVGAVVRVDGSASYTVDHAAGDQLPDDSCTRLDPDVTA
jgi:hypothetical protein